MRIQNTPGFWPVALALGGNSFVTVIKFVAAALSGSSALFSEAIHSLADTVNQALLLVGLRQSLRKPDENFEYGYGNERFFWALISACGIFFVGAGVTAYSGISSLLHPGEVELHVSIAVVLVVSFAIEMYTLVVAARQLVARFPQSSWGERLESADSATLAVLLEDSVAVLGVVIAGGCIWLTHVTGQTAWDAIGSLVIAALLSGVAIILIVRNRSYLLGKSLPDDTRNAVIDFLQRDPMIEKVIDFKSTILGLGIYRIKCEVEFNGAMLSRKAYREANLKNEFEEIGDDFELFKRFASEHADRIPRLIGRKIDEIEQGIRSRFPEIRHIDIEVN